MVNLAEIDLLRLPWVPLNATGGFPSEPGIYFAIDPFNQIQYIGRSGDVHGRWKNHHRYKDLAAIGGVKVAYLFVSDSSSLAAIEADLIKQFNPPLNTSRPTANSSTKQSRRPKRQAITTDTTFLNYADLQNKLASLQADRDRLLASGDILRGCWIDSTTARGIVYKRLRVWKDGKATVDRTLKPEEISCVSAAIDRGRELARLDREIAQTVKAIDKTATAAAKLGIPLDRMMK